VPSILIADACIDDVDVKVITVHRPEGPSSCQCLQSCGQTTSDTLIVICDEYKIDHL
jgi:hypothetical protein